VTDESPATPEPGRQPAVRQPAVRQPAAEPRLDEPERLLARKYAGGDVMHHDGRHAWLKLVPDKVTSWDFRILYQAQN
jgi:hypothetical protein